MKFLICFRGLSSRVENVTGICANLQDFILKLLAAANHEYAVYFFTHNIDPDKIKIFQDSLNPKKIYLTNNGQIVNFLDALGTVATAIDETYDYVIFLRFEMIYKKSILEWDFYGKKGIIVPYKEDNEQLFNQERYYGDVIIIISSEYVKQLFDIMRNVPFQFYSPPNCLHSINRFIANHNIPVSTLVEGYYQSNTALVYGDPRLNPFYIMTHKQYYQPDRANFAKYIDI